MDSNLNPAEFFAYIKTTAGFDNPGKSLYTTVRELVENSLDSAESDSILPDVVITIQEITKKVTKKVKRPKNAASFYRVTCKDNGKGMPHADIPNMFGKVLSGTKYGLKQTRGKFGLGAKMALLWSKMSTGQPIKISSAMQDQNLTVCSLDIDIHQNSPIVYGHKECKNKDKWRGTEIQIVIEGNWSNSKSNILRYMRQTAVITPYAQFLFKFVSETPDKNVTVRFDRTSESMPLVPIETKYHPSAVNVLIIERLIRETSNQTLLQFLQHEFVNINEFHAKHLIGKMGPEFSPKMAVNSLTQKQIVIINRLFRQAKFDDPSGDCLSPAGEYNLGLGIMKELNPDMLAMHSGSAQVYEGHPFIVEAGVSVGGKHVKQGLNIFRFANRIPLLFEQGADVVTRTAEKKINWARYKINQKKDKIGIFVSIVSTKIPFKDTGKEYIGDGISEIAFAVKCAIEQCCKQLKPEIVKRTQARVYQERKEIISKYIPSAAKSIFEVLREPPLPTNIQPTFENMSYFERMQSRVQAGTLTAETLKEKLVRSVEKDYATQTAVGKEPRDNIYLQSFDLETNSIDLHCPTFCVRYFSRD